MSTGESTWTEDDFEPGDRQIAEWHEAGHDTECPRCGTLIMDVDGMMEGHLAGHDALDEAAAWLARKPLPVVDISQPVDWLAAIETITPHHLDPGYLDYYDREWAAFLRQQLGRAMMYLEERRDAVAVKELATIARRAAVILNAEPEAPELERQLGIRTAPQFEGKAVRCRNQRCRLRYTCQPEDPYFDATTAANGICTACMLAETRTDLAAAVPVPELEGTVVPKAVRAPRRKAVTSG